MAERNDKMRARARFWLRAERAFGVKSINLGEHLVEPLAPAELSISEESFTPKDPQTAENPPEMMAWSGLMPPHSDAPFTSPLLPTEQKRSRLIAMDNKEVRGCTRCRLCESRTQTVFGEGNVDAQIIFVGEGPGRTEDETGRPFVGRAGEKLNEMIRAMGLTREQVYIANIVKCRPPGNREPAPDEVATCTPFLERQIEIIRPRVIVTLGRPALQFMLGKKISISKMRGQWQSWRGVKLMPTFHPAYILRSYTPEVRAAVWNDLKLVMSELGLPIPARQRSAP